MLPKGDTPARVDDVAAPVPVVPEKVDEGVHGNAAGEADGVPVLREGDGAPAGANQGEKRVTLPSHVSDAIATLPPPAEGTIRVYRGESDGTAKIPVPDWVRDSDKYKETLDATGRWFTENPEIAQTYANDAGSGRLVYMDVPAEVAKASRVADLAHARRFSLDPNNELFLPKEYAGKASPISAKQGESGRTVQTNVDRTESMKPEVAQTLEVGSTRVNYKGGVETLMEVPLDEVDMMPGNRIFPEAVEKYFKDPGRIAPEYRIQDNGRFLSYDGGHRTVAARQRGDKTIKAWVSRSGQDGFPEVPSEVQTPKEKE